MLTVISRITKANELLRITMGIILMRLVDVETSILTVKGIISCSGNPELHPRRK